MAEEPKSQPQPEPQSLDYRKELFDLLDQMSSMGLQISLIANNTKGRIKELESKSDLR